MLTVIAPALRSANPRNSRNPSSPKITPLAPTTTVFGSPNSHAPRPLLSAVNKMTPRKRPSVTATYAITPRTAKISEFESRWPKPACRNGANRMPSRPDTVRGWMP